MTPEQQHQDAVVAAREWREEECTQVPGRPEPDEPRYRRLWIDSGSGPAS